MKESKKSILELTCDTIMNGNNDFDGNIFIILAQIFSKFNVKCPNKCRVLANEAVTGNFLYKDDSPICLAAIHAGMIDDINGGAFSVRYFSKLIIYLKYKK